MASLINRLDFWDKEENKRQREEEARRAAQAAAKPPQRNIASRAFDQLNPIDNNRTWKQAAPTQSKSTFQQVGQLGGQTVRGMFNPIAKTANTGLAALNVGNELRKTAQASVFGSDRDYSNAVQNMARNNNRFIKPGSGVLGTGSWFKDTNEATNIGTKDLAGRIVGAGAETYLAGKGLKMGGFTGKALLDQGLKNGVKTQLPNLGKNAVVNTLEGVARGRNEGQGWKDSAKTGALSGVIGTVGDVGLGVGAAGIRKGISNLPSPKPLNEAGFIQLPGRQKPFVINEGVPTVQPQKPLQIKAGVPLANNPLAPRKGLQIVDNNPKPFKITDNSVPKKVSGAAQQSMLSKAKNAWNNRTPLNEGGYIQVPGKNVDPLESLKQEATPKYMQDKVTPEGYFTEGRYKDSAYPKNFVAKADIPHTNIKAGDRVALIKGRDGRFDAILSKKYKEKSTGYTISRESYVDPESFTQPQPPKSPPVQKVETPVESKTNVDTEPDYKPEYYSDKEMQQMAIDHQKWVETETILQKNFDKSDTELSKLTGMSKKEVADYKSEVADATKSINEMHAMFEKNALEEDTVAKKKIPDVVKRINEIRKTDTSKMSKRALDKLRNDANSLQGELMRTMDDLYGTDKQVKFNGETYYVKGEVKIGKDTFSYLDGEGEYDRTFIKSSDLESVSQPKKPTPFEQNLQDAGMSEDEFFQRFNPAVRDEVPSLSRSSDGPDVPSVSPRKSPQEVLSQGQPKTPPLRSGKTDIESKMLAEAKKRGYTEKYTPDGQIANTVDELMKEQNTLRDVGIPLLDKYKAKMDGKTSIEKLMTTAERKAYKQAQQTSDNASNLLKEYFESKKAANTPAAPRRSQSPTRAGMSEDMSAKKASQWTTPLPDKGPTPIPKKLDSNGVQIKPGDKIEFPGQWLGNGTLDNNIPFKIVERNGKPFNGVSNTQAYAETFGVSPEQAAKELNTKPKGFIASETKPRNGRKDTVRVSKNPETGRLQRTIQSENAPEFKALDQPEVTARMEQYGKPEVPESQPVRMPETKAEKKALVNEFMDLTNEYLGKERSGSISATEIAKKYNDQFGGLSEKQKLEAILTLDGMKKTTDPQVQAAVKALSDQYDQSYNYFTKERGINMGFRQDYSPRIYDVNGQKMNAQEYKLLQAGSGRQKGRKAEPLYEDLLVSKDPAELLQKYQTSLEKAAAGKEYLSKLEKSGMIQTATDPSAARGLKPIVAEGMLADGTIYYAKPDVADKLNKLFGSQEASGFFEKAVEKAQGFNSFVQSFVLSGGVPNTPINAFGIMQVMKSGMAGHPIQGGKAFLTGLSKTNADKFFNSNSKYVKMMAEQGLDTRYNYSIKPSKGIDRIKTAYDEKGATRGIGQAWDELTNDATFGRFMPALEVMHYKGVYDGLIAKKVDPKIAAKQAADATSNFFGKTTLAKEATGSKIGRDAAGAFLFAPRFRESMLNFWGKNVKALNPKNMGKIEYRDNLKFMAASAATWAAMEGANKALTGEWMHDNPDGKKDKLLIPGGGLTGGKDIGIPFLPSIATVPRNVASGAFNLATGNLKEAGKNAQSFLSIPARTGSELLTNEDYFGSQIVNEDSTASERLGQMASHVVKNNLQPWIREGLNAAGQNLGDDTKKTLGIKKQTPFETGSKALEAPLRFYNPDYYKYGGVGLDKDQREMLRDMSGDQKKQFKEQSIKANKIDNQAEKEKKTAKYKGEEGIKKLANGEFYTKVGKTYKTFETETEAKVAKEKNDFKNSKDSERTIDGVKYRKTSSGTIVKATTPKAKKETKKSSGRKSSGGRGRQPSLDLLLKAISPVKVPAIKTSKLKSSAPKLPSMKTVKTPRVATRPRNRGNVTSTKVKIS